MSIYIDSKAIYAMGSRNNPSTNTKSKEQVYDCNLKKDKTVQHLIKETDGGE